MLAVIATHAGEAAFEVATVEELVDDFRDDRAQEAVAGLVAFLINVQKPVKTPLQALPEWRSLGLSGTVGLNNHAFERRQEGVSSNGIPLKKVRGK